MKRTLRNMRKALTLSLFLSFQLAFPSGNQPNIKNPLQLPKELILHSFSFIHDEVKNFTLVNKDLHSKMFDENGNPRTNFLCATAGINGWKDSYSVKVEKLFSFLFKSKIVPTLNNIREIIGDELVLSHENYKITKESLVKLALDNDLKSTTALKAALSFLYEITKENLGKLTLDNNHKSTKALKSAVSFLYEITTENLIKFNSDDNPKSTKTLKAVISFLAAISFLKDANNKDLIKRIIKLFPVDQKIKFLKHIVNIFHKMNNNINLKMVTQILNDNANKLADHVVYLGLCKILDEIYVMVDQIKTLLFFYF